MIQELTADKVDRYIEASPAVLYDLISDVTRTPEYSPEVKRCVWIKGATGPVVGARFKATNSMGRGPDFPNKPVVVAAEPDRYFAFARTEPFGGTVEWRYRFTPEGTGTRVEESYEVTKKVGRVGWFIIDTLYGLKDRQTDLRTGMITSLDRIAALTQTVQN